MELDRQYSSSRPYLIRFVSFSPFPSRNVISSAAIPKYDFPLSLLVRLGTLHEYWYSARSAPSWFHIGFVLFFGVFFFFRFLPFNFEINATFCSDERLLLSDVVTSLL